MKRNSALKNGGKMDSEPMVGIFWLFKGELIFDVTPVSAAEPYGDCVGHANSHIEFLDQSSECRRDPSRCRI